MLNDEADAIARRAVELLEAGQDLAALSQAEQLVAAFPDRPAYRVLRGYAFAHGGQYDHALADAHAALELDCASLDAQLLLARSAQPLGHMQEAQQAYERAVQLSEYEGEVLAEFAEFMAWHRAPRLAEEKALQAVEKSPQSAAGWAALALAQFRQGRRVEARSSAQRALELDPRCRQGQLIMSFLLDRPDQSAQSAALARLLEDENPDLGEYCDEVRRRDTDRLIARKLFERAEYRDWYFGGPRHRGWRYYVIPLLKVIGYGMPLVLLFMLSPWTAVSVAVTLLFIWWMNRWA